MVVKILYQGKEFSGKVIYNFKTVSDVILLRFDYCLEEGCREVLIYKDKLTNKWYDTENIETKFPGVFEQLMYKLRNVFGEADRFQEKSIEDI